jgi:hypothetical protein
MLANFSSETLTVLKAKISRDNPDQHQRLESLKESLKTAYKAVNRANKNSHLNNKDCTTAEPSYERSK